jgi:hypothetical protein
MSGCRCAAILLDKGLKIAEGPPSDVIAAYHRLIVGAQRPTAPGDHPAYAHRLLTLTNLTFRGGDGPGVVPVRSGDPLIAQLRFAATPPVADVQFELSFFSADGRTLFATLRTPPQTVDVTGGVVEFDIPALPLQPGAYHAGAAARDATRLQVIDWWDGGSTVYVEPADRPAPGHVHVPHRTRIVKDQSSVASAKPS